MQIGLRVANDHPDLHLGIGLVELRQARGDPVRPEAVAGPQRDRTGDEGACGSCFAAQCFRSIGHAVHMPEDLLAHIRQLNAARGPQENLGAEVSLEIVNLPADGRWRLAEANGRRAHARQFGNDAKNAQRIPIQTIN